MTENLLLLVEERKFKEILIDILWKDYLNYILNIKKNLKWNKGFALDIDETLSATNVKWFEEMFELFWNPENLTPIQAADKYWIAQKAPYFQDKQEITDWMHIKRQDNDFQELLPLIWNANEIYNKIHEENIEITLYITARPESVKNWTEKWLKKNNFPNSEIILRPDSLDHKYSNLWKASVLEILYPEIDWIVDDNLDLIKFISQDYKWIICAYTHDLDFWKRNIVSCKTHNDVINYLSKIYKK